MMHVEALYDKSHAARAAHRSVYLFAYPLRNRLGLPAVEYEYHEFEPGWECTGKEIYNQHNMVEFMGLRNDPP